MTLSSNTIDSDSTHLDTYNGETRVTSSSKTNNFKMCSHLHNKEMHLHKLLRFHLYPHQLLLQHLHLLLLLHWRSWSGWWPFKICNSSRRSWFGWWLWFWFRCWLWLTGVVPYDFDVIQSDCTNHVVGSTYASDCYVEVQAVEPISPSPLVPDIQPSSSTLELKPLPDNPWRILTKSVGGAK